MVREKYNIHAPDHDFSQAWDLVRIVEIALHRANLNLSDEALAQDRTAIRDAIATVRQLFWKETFFQQPYFQRTFKNIPPKMKSTILTYLSRASAHSGLF